MAVSATYYLNGPDLSSSTTVYLNSDLTTVAPDGFFSDGVISREQVSGVLLPEVVCGTCGTPCGSPISGSGSTGVYLLNLEAGGTPSDIGAIIIRFDPYSVPDGIKAVYNGNTYNALTSPVDGSHKSSNPSNFTVIGDSAFDCGLVGNTSNFPTLAEFIYDGSSFVSTGNTQNITIYPGDVSLGAAPGNCMMVIPKTTATPSLINFQFIGPCGSTGWAVDIQCPTLLTGFSSTVMAPSDTSVCALSETVTYYNASLAGTPGIVGLYDFVYLDAYGAMPLSAGFYRATGSIVGGNDWFQVDSNGVVIDLGVCSPVVNCKNYTFWTYTNAQANYTDCEGNPQIVSIGGTSGYDATTFCAEEGSITSTGDGNIIDNGPCV